ncbi:MAG: hypothetical protein IAF38_06950 [Bacteroidia bacterium]|nr:hypothetical protein [Bacteroidia bacterium]
MINARFRIFAGVFFGFVIVVFFQSCDVHKRLYRDGFFVSGKSKKVKLQRSERINTNAAFESAQENIVSERIPEKNSAEKIILQHKVKSQKQIVSQKPSKIKSRSPEHFVVRKKEGFEKIKYPLVIPEEIDFKEEQKIKTKSLASFILAIAAFVLTPLSFIIGAYGLLFFVGIACAVLAIIFGAQAVRRKKKYPLPVAGSAFGKIGLVLGIVYFGLLTLVLIGLIVLLAAFGF